MRVGVRMAIAECGKWGSSGLSAYCLSSRVKRGIWVCAGHVGTAGAGKNLDPSLCSG